MRRVIQIKKENIEVKNQDTTTAKNASKANVAKQKRKKLFSTHRHGQWHANVLNNNNNCYKRKKEAELSPLQK